MIKIKTKILLVIIFLFSTSCKENIKKIKQNKTSITTKSVIKDTIKIFSNKSQVKGKCNQNEWVKKYINELDVAIIKHDKHKIVVRNFGSLLLENQKFYLGYIGINKKKLDIKFNAVAVDKSNEFKYFLSGYTIVNKNKRIFKGFVELENIYRFAHFSTGIDGIMNGEVKDQGVIVANYLLKEDSKLSATGVFTGKCIVKWYIDKANVFKYDKIEDYSDSYSNNLFIGTWTSYKTNKSQIVAWGQYRIPCAGDLDIGAAEFSPNEKYNKYGWADYKP